MTVWQSRAACLDHDPETWFDEHRVPDALAICFDCPVRIECADAALDRETSRNSRHGIWGGFDPDDRHALAPRARAAP